MIRAFLFLSLLFWLCAAPLPSAAQPDRTPPPRQDTRLTQAPRDPYTPRIPPRAIAYQRSHRILGLTALGWHWLGLWLMLRCGLSARLRDAAYRALRLAPPETNAPPPFRAVALYFFVFSILLTLWLLPAGFGRLAIERHYGFARQTPLGYLGDTFLRALFDCLMIPVLWGGYRLYARVGSQWWKWLWAILTPLLFFQIVLQPILVDPAFNRFTPLEPGPLRERILALAAKAGITGGRVFVVDTSRRTTHVNAYVTGLGPTTRIVLNDTALHSLPEDQLLAMVGHEMGHYVEGHIWIQLVGGTLGAGFFLWMIAWAMPYAVRRWGERWRLRGVSDLAALPLLMLILSLFLFAQAPLASAASRVMERRADAFDLRVTGLYDATARLFVRFAEQDYSDPDPPALLQFWFGSHPALSERIAFARAQASSKKSE